MRCAILGDRTDTWVPVSNPAIEITRNDVDTMTQVFERVSISGAEVVEDFPIGAAAAGPGRASGLLAALDLDELNMYITSVSLAQDVPRMWKATVTWTGIYEYVGRVGAFGTVIQIKGSNKARNLFKPVQTDVRTYADTFERIDEDRTKSNILRVPRLTITERYVTSESPDNDEIGGVGRPIKPPSTVDLPDVPDSTLFKKVNVDPDGWILNTRNWTQVLDKDIYSVTDEWEYQTDQVIIENINLDE